MKSPGSAPMACRARTAPGENVADLRPKRYSLLACVRFPISSCSVSFCLDESSPCIFSRANISSDRLDMDVSETIVESSFQYQPELKCSSEAASCSFRSLLKSMESTFTPVDVGIVRLDAISWSMLFAVNKDANPQ